MKRPRVLFSSTSEHFTRRRVGTVPPILVQVFARRHFQPLMATLAEICQILKSVWTEMFVCIWRHLEVKTTYIQWFYMDTNLKSKVNGKYWKHILSTVHILSLLSSCKTVAPCIWHLGWRTVKPNFQWSFSSAADFFPTDDRCFITYRFDSLSLYPGAAVQANFRTLEEGTWQLTTQHTSDNRKHNQTIKFNINYVKKKWCEYWYHSLFCCYSSWACNCVTLQLFTSGPATLGQHPVLLHSSRERTGRVMNDLIRILSHYT